ncbi:DNA polymerase III subunit epsilon [Marinobacterium sp. LSUCC0821]|uniref:DNA polymerase III subunit epsilon n=1 Tax=Marinobacterium sp. LSUCC0821 TaxID=2668067 RepID=UPI00145136B2|nr:DNA polymerase III subunit epsilon [Marinobacterium sp. LSUCC0821]QJD71191.1 DNA polymerase III subunit epsilon [Marinobacterium sp. LSUCC0821]
MSRQIVLDTETTGLEPDEGHNIIEIGCVEMVARRITGNNYHQYIKPDREVDAEAIEVHGITNQFLEDKPKFSEVVAEFVEFVRGAELIIHNAAFDVGFINKEFQRNGIDEKIEDICTITDSLALARKKHPGQKNSLDALCRRYFIDNSHRELHGALLDSEILADVYLALTGGQTSLILSVDGQDDGEGGEKIRRVAADLVEGLQVIKASDEELAAHETFLDLLDKKSDGAVWRNL